MVTAAYSNRHLHAGLEWNTSKAQPFTARLTTFGAPVRFTYRAHFGQPDATHHLRAAYSPPPDSANRTRASFGVAMRGGALDSYTLELSASGRHLKWSS